MMKLIALAFLLLAVGAYADHDDNSDESEEKEGSEMAVAVGKKPKYSSKGYLINYNLACSVGPSCYCERVCVQWRPCNCACPPPCPPATTTPFPTAPTVGEGPKCVNGAPGDHYPDCCFNGGRGRFCCQNGADNLHCCLNGANNPWCSLPTEPPVQAPPGGGGGDDCNQCRCQPCIPWIPCQPCPCMQRCGGFGK